MTLACSTGAFYVGAVHRTKQQSTLPIKASEEESPRVSFHPRVPGSSSANGDLSVYLQRELCVSPRATGPSARRASVDLELRRMQTQHTPRREQAPRLCIQLGVTRQGCHFSPAFKYPPRTTPNRYKATPSLGVTRQDCRLVERDGTPPERPLTMYAGGESR